MVENNPTYIKCLNLGCGTTIEYNRMSEEWVNVDRFDGYGIRQMDLDKLPWNFKDNEFDFILAISILEHLDISIVELFKELHRILKPNGTIEIEVPHRTCPAYGAEGHRKFFWIDSFTDRTKSGSGHDLEVQEAYNGFERMSREITFYPEIPLSGLLYKIVNYNEKAMMFYEFSIMSSLFLAKNMRFVLRKCVNE